jgi:hypothetical protein
MAATGQRPVLVSLLERRQDICGRRQRMRIVRVIPDKRAGHGVCEFEGFFASEVPHQKFILTTRSSRSPGLEGGDQFSRALSPAAHGYPFDPIARLNV